MQIDIPNHTETPPPPDALVHLWRIDATVIDINSEFVLARTGVNMRIIIPRSVFDRRDCLPKPGTAISFDVQQWSCGALQYCYVSRLMVGHRMYAASTPPTPATGADREG